MPVPGGPRKLVLLGPPSTAKSALGRALGQRLQGQTFEYQLTRFTEPSKLGGPFDIRRLREGDLVTNTAGMPPEAHLVFLDKMLKPTATSLTAGRRSLRKGEIH